MELATFADGRFEVYRDGEKIYSKRETGRFPEWEEIHTLLESAAG